MQGVADLPVVLDIPNKVVYSPHNYPFYRGENGPYDIVPYEYMKEDLDRTWGLLTDDWKEPLLDWRTKRLRQIQKVVLGPGFNMKWSDKKVTDCN